MSRKKDQNVVFVGTGMTSAQASNLVSEIVKAKKKIAPNSRGTAAIASNDGIPHLLSKGFKSIGKK